MRRPVAKRRILFVDRDGTLIVEPDDQQIDTLEKLELITGVIPSLLKLREAGYEFVMVSNQDGLGTDTFPIADFEKPQEKLLRLLESLGSVFSGIHIDPQRDGVNAPTGKAGIGMVLV
jgi:imidazoleglycerol-phosphate dehydratase/histidinol-phosphatase